MTFLNPFALVGLIAAAIPLVLHLLNLRKLRTVEFSTLRFLKELQRSTIRRIQIKQWLLLVLRTLLIIAVVLAFSRPALRGSLSGIGSHAKTSILIILDNSATMALQNDQGVFLQQSVRTAEDLISLLKEGDDVLFLRLSDLPSGTMNEPTHDFEHVRRMIRQTEITSSYRTIEDALRLGSRLFQQSRNINQEIFVLTDGQRTTMLDPRNKERSGVPEMLFSPNAKVFFLSLNRNPVSNCSVEDLKIPTSLIQPGKLFRIQARIANLGSEPVRNYLVSLFVDGSRVMQKAITLEKGQRSTLEFTARAARSGYLPCSIELEDDGFIADNKYYFSLYVPAAISTILVSSNSGQQPFLPLALSVLNTEMGSRFIDFREVPPSGLTSSLLAYSDVVIISNAASFTPLQCTALAEFVRTRGGGIILLPGNNARQEEYRTLILPALGLPEIAPDDTSRSGIKRMPAFQHIDYDNPLFWGMFETKSGTREASAPPAVESPNIRIYWRFSASAATNTIISLTDGHPFLSERSLGSGRILLFAVAADTGWSDFPTKGIFLPLITQSLLYTARTPLGATGAVAGEQYDIPVSRLVVAPVAQLSLTTPTAEEIILQRGKNTRAAAGSISLGVLPVPGFYTVKQKTDTLSLIAANADPRESNGALASPDEAEQLMSSLGVAGKGMHFLRESGQLPSVVLQSRYGTELWKYFFIVALFLAVAEMIIARESKQTPAAV